MKEFSRCLPSSSSADEKAALAGGPFFSFVIGSSVSGDEQNLLLVFPVRLGAMNFRVGIGNRLIVRRAELRPVSLCR
jgi:hypothetical protein